MHERLRAGLSALAEVHLVDSSSIEQMLARVSVYEDLANTLAPCADFADPAISEGHHRAGGFAERRPRVQRSPQQHWRQIWSTNPLERVNNERTARTAATSASTPAADSMPLGRGHPTDS